MVDESRRSLIKALGAGSLAAAMPASIARALAIPANNRTGSIEDVEHIVFLMQENRSFDHYLGTLRGVRGFGDPRAVTLPDGHSVFEQPNGRGGVVLPFRPDAENLGLTFLPGLPHDWASGHAAWNGGKYDKWVPSKGNNTMAYLTRDDMPFHYALADAFTVCDAYHCSLMSATDPNRYHMWTGWVGNDGKGGGPVIDNAEKGYGWTTYPERLQAAGIAWKVYQDIGKGLDAAHSWGDYGTGYIGNYGDNALLYFLQYQNAQPGSELYQRARTGTDVSTSGTLFDNFIADVNAGNLPQVSWVVAPEAYSEHPNWPVNYGAYYISAILDALTANPEVWSKTALIVMYDENDGYFDHVVPPTPPAPGDQRRSTVSITNENYAGSSSYAAGPYGLGVRVPAFIVSPWSRGGYVNSQVFDHTSLIRFVERRFGVSEPNITPWRRAVAGDLTSAFNFATPNADVPSLPDTAAYAPPDMNRHSSFASKVPSDQSLPQQEQGQRLARALPYALDAYGVAGQGGYTIVFNNMGTATAVFHVRSADQSQAPRTYTISPGRQLNDNWSVALGGTYDLSVSGPNGFLREFRGKLGGDGAASISVVVKYQPRRLGLVLFLNNLGAGGQYVKITDQYTGQVIERLMSEDDESMTLSLSCADNQGWYDYVITSSPDTTFRVQIAGHIENGRDSIADPAIGAVA